MNCVFCCKLVPNWEESEDCLRKPALQNPSLFDFFCRQVGIDVDGSTISSLDKVPNCEECYLIYDELQIVYIQLEDLKCQVDRHVGELKKRVVVSNADDDTGQIFSNTSPSDLGPVVLRFRQQIIKAKQPRGAVSDVLASCSGFSGIVKSEQQEIKLEPLDIDMGSYSDSNDNDEFEIHPQSDKQDDKDSADNDEDYFCTYDVPTENLLSERRTRARRLVQPQLQELDEETLPEKKSPRKRSSTTNRTSTTKKSDVGSSRGRKSKSDGGVKKRKTRAARATKVPEKFKVKRMVISSDESDDEAGEDENQGKLTSNSKNKLPCPICGKFFPKPSKLQRHHLIVHEKQRPFNCEFCEKSFARKHAFIMHLINNHEIENDKPLTCPEPECGKKFTLQILLDRHVAFHKFDATKPLKCTVCEVRFPEGKMDLLERHMQLTHTKRPNSFHCEPCNISFQNRNLLLKHDLQFHMDKFIYNCHHCDKRYSIQELLDTHVLTHSTTGPWQCKVCKWEVLTAELLSEHLLSHTGEKRLKCKDCDERFFSLAELKRHGVHVHGAEKPFKCQFCKNTYILNSDRTAHIREVHAGFPNQFKCDICLKGFSNKKYLSNHIKKIHEFSNVVICAICGKRLAGPSSLRDHMNSHEGIKPFECSYCSKRFVKKNSLKCHIMIHTGEKPFVCDICGKSYNQSHCLKSHLKSHANAKTNVPNIPTAASNDSSSNSTLSISQPLQHPHPQPSTMNPTYSIAEHISYASFYQNL